MNRGHVARVEAAVEQEALVRVTRLGLVAAMADVRTLLPSTLRYAYGRRPRRDKGRLVSDSWKSARLLSSTCLTPSACSSATRASRCTMLMSGKARRLLRRISIRPSWEAPAVAPHDPLRSADACRSAIGQPHNPAAPVVSFSRCSFLAGNSMTTSVFFSGSYAHS